MFLEKFFEAFLSYAEFAANCCLGCIDDRTFGIISGLAELVGFWPAAAEPIVLATTTPVPIATTSSLASASAPWWPARASPAPALSVWASSWTRSVSVEPRRGHAIMDSVDLFATGFLLDRHFRPYDDAVAPVA